MFYITLNIEDINGQQQQPNVNPGPEATSAKDDTVSQSNSRWYLDAFSGSKLDDEVMLFIAYPLPRAIAFSNPNVAPLNLPKSHMFIGHT